MLLGLGFGVPCLLGLVHFARTGEVWTFMGFPTYGGGPFERLGLPTSVPLLAAFLFPVPAWLVGAIIIAVNVLGLRQASSIEGDNVAYDVHLFGAVFARTRSTMYSSMVAST